MQERQTTTILDMSDTSTNTTYSYNITGLEEGTTYSYVVTAVNSIGNTTSDVMNFTTYLQGMQTGKYTCSRNSIIMSKVISHTQKGLLIVPALLS